MPIDWLGDAAEMAQVALFLVSDALALLHSVALVVDGGKAIF
jgi:NAD(P)-dependent dehydrogenase (short-subunit alcohol dehydrogenase family)